MKGCRVPSAVAVCFQKRSNCYLTVLLKRKKQKAKLDMSNVDFCFAHIKYLILCNIVVPMICVYFVNDLLGKVQALYFLSFFSCDILENEC